MPSPTLDMLKKRMTPSDKSLALAAAFAVIAFFMVIHALVNFNPSNSKNAAIVIIAMTAGCITLFVLHKKAQHNKTCSPEELDRLINELHIGDDVAGFYKERYRDSQTQGYKLVDVIKLGDNHIKNKKDYAAHNPDTTAQNQPRTKTIKSNSTNLTAGAIKITTFHGESIEEALANLNKWAEENGSVRIINIETMNEVSGYVDVSGSIAQKFVGVRVWYENQNIRPETNAT